MQSQNRLLDDLAKVATSAMGTLSGMREEVEAQFRQRFERVLSQMDLVTREEYEVTKAIAEAARAEQEALTERVAELEARLAELSPAKTTAAKPARKAASKTAPKSGTKTAD